MPRGDRTGPRGQGPRTGRSKGNCGPADGNLVTRGQGARGARKGQGRGSGQGRGTGQDRSSPS